MRVLQVFPTLHPAAGEVPVVVECTCQHLSSSGYDARILMTSFLCADGGNNLQRALFERIEAEVLPGCAGGGQ